MRTLRVALAQINTTVGDLDGNVTKTGEYIARARDLGADLIAFPELTITGYPPEDLLLRPQFIQDNREGLEEVIAHCDGITAVVGFVDQRDDIYNAAAVIHDGRLVDVYHKQFLPNYGVFDENRYFQVGTRCPVYTVAGVPIGVNICEDIWYPGDPLRSQALAGAQVIVNINSSPFHAGKRHFRERMIGTRASDNSAVVCYVNLVGGQDELVFDGNSMIFNAQGELLAHGPSFEEDLLLCDLNLDEVVQARLHNPRRRQERLDLLNGNGIPRIHVSDEPAAEPKPPLTPHTVAPLDGEAEVYSALVMGTKDYVHKTGFHKVVIGLSGGIDSSITAAIAADALGPENVVGVAMPSRFSSEGSVLDAKQVAENLGIRMLIVPIEEVFSAHLNALSEPFDGTDFGTAEENLQARIRGNYLMALSNKFGWLVLTTGNKSEMACGYSTLYGDMAGGFAVIKDVPKTLVYRLSEYRNAQAPSPVIPRSVIDKAPSAELRPNQTDQDSLPPYEVLDPIIEAYVENDKGLDEIAAMGFDEVIVRKVIKLINGSEYKRRQAPPGIKITPRAFGRDRRLPIANRYSPS